MAQHGIHNREEDGVLVIKLPVIFTKDTMYWLVKNLFKGLKKRPRKVALDFDSLKDIQVGGITTLSNIIEFCRSMGIKTVFRHTDDCKAVLFLQGSGLLTQYQQTPADREARHKFLPLQLVEYDKSFTHVHHQMVPWLASVLDQDERALTSLKAGLGEVFNNIKDHSTVSVGCSASHYDAAEDKITMCVADFGVGIPGRVRSKMELATDQAAIAMACQQGFSTKTTPRNRGAGLHVLVQNIVARNHGTVIIYSGEGIYSCAHQSGGPFKGTGRAAPGKYPGTMIYMTLKKSEFVPDHIDEEEFQWD